jgi:hypothetical protein
MPDENQQENQIKKRVISRRHTGKNPEPVEIADTVVGAVAPAAPKRAVKKSAAKKQKTCEQPVWSNRISDNPEQEDGIDLRSLFAAKPSKTKRTIEEWQQGVAVGEQDMPAIGIAFPSFCLEMLTGHTVLPVSSCYALAGPTGSFKSHLVLEIARWVANVNGAVVLAENEAKYNADMARAVMGRQYGKRVWVYNCTSFNQVQQTMMRSLERMNSQTDGDIPMLQIVDSIVGNATESSQDKVKREGEIERGYPPNALAAANFLPNYMPCLGNKPYLGVWVTHSSETTEGTGPYARKVTSLKGGGSWEYRCRIAFILTRSSELPVYDDRTWQVQLILKLKKDAAIRGFKLPIKVRCSNDVLFDERNGDYFNERRLRFCWDSATVELWKNPERWGYPAFYKDVVADVTGFKEVKISGRKQYIAPKIGIGTDLATKDTSKILDALYSSPDILDRLRAEMGIQKGIAFQKGIKFDAMLEQAKQIAVRRAAMLSSSSDITYIRKAEINEID